MSRALRDGAAGPEAFGLLLRLLSGHFDRVHLGAGCKKLHAFGVPKGVPSRSPKVVRHAKSMQSYCIPPSSLRGQCARLVAGGERTP